MRSEATNANDDGVGHRAHVLPYDLIPDTWWNDTHQHVTHALHKVRHFDWETLPEQLPSISIEMAIGSTCFLLLLLVVVYRWASRPPALKKPPPARCLQCVKCSNGQHVEAHPCRHRACAEIGATVTAPSYLTVASRLAAQRKTQ